MQLLGRRVVLREAAFDDWPAVHSWASRPEVCRYQTWGPNAPAETQAHVRRICEAAAAVPRTNYTLIAAQPADGRIVGSGTLLVRSASSRAGEIAYVVHPDMWGQGLGSEIASILLRFAFEELGMHRVYATCDPRNIGSGRVLQKIGMTHEGRMRGTHLIRDGWRDSDLYAILEDEWRALVRTHG